MKGRLKTALHLPRQHHPLIIQFPLDNMLNEQFFCFEAPSSSTASGVPVTHPGQSRPSCAPLQAIAPGSPGGSVPQRSIDIILFFCPLSRTLVSVPTSTSPRLKLHSIQTACKVQRFFPLLQGVLQYGFLGRPVLRTKNDGEKMHLCLSISSTSSTERKDVPYHQIAASFS